MFLNSHALKEKGLAIDHSRISKFLSEKAFLSFDLRATLEPFFEEQLPEKAVDDEKDILGFHLIPSVSKELDLLTSNPRPQEQHPNFLASFGDARVTLQDIKRLIARESASEMNWISDETINMLTNLFSGIPEKNDCFFFSSLLLESLFNIFYGKGSYSSMSEEEKLSQMQQKANSQGDTREGPSQAFTMSKRAFWPCLVNKNHWIGFRIDRETRQITWWTRSGDRATILQSMESYWKRF